MRKLESTYQRRLQKRIKEYFNSEEEKHYILKNVTLQGFPDLTIYFPNLGKFILLEVKGYALANVQPNQEYYIDEFSNEKSFASFIYPENEEKVLKQIKEFIYN